MKAAQDWNIAFVGTGAIGGSVGAWVAQKHANTYLLGRGAKAQALREKGISLYQGEGQPERVAVKVLDSLSELPDVDVAVIAVKLYDLQDAAQMVREQLGDRTLALGLQNGVENQNILPHYFSRAAYGVVDYNAWMDAPGVIGYQAKGPLVIGTPDNSLQAELQTLAAIFSQGVETLVTTHLQDAVHSKLVINLANSVTTLMRPKQMEPGELDRFQELLANTIYEGVQVIRAAGYHEERQGDLPSWSTLWAAAKLPHFLTRGTFRRNLQRLPLSSMGQDVLQRGRSQTELEYLNGYLLELAERQGVAAPYNRAIYRLCKQQFSRPGFQPLDVEAVWNEVQLEKSRS